MQYLKADTETKVVIGPVVAVGDGFTPVTNLDVNTADEAEIMKHNASAVTDISANTFAAIASADGYYNLTITAGQLDTEGRLTVLINDDSLCLPVRMDFIVVNANVFDSLFAAAATDYLDVELLTATQASIDAIETDTTSLNDTKVPQTLNLTASGNIGIDWANVENPTTALDLSGTDIQLCDTVTTLTGHTAQTGDSYALANGAAGFVAIDTVVDAIKVITDALGATAAARLALSAGQIIPGTVDTGSFSSTTTEFEADDITEATADHYNGRIVIFTSGALAGQASDITDYSLSGSNGHFTVTALTEAPANDVAFVIV